jgi:hypothetical protein
MAKVNLQPLAFRRMTAIQCPVAFTINSNLGSPPWPRCS